jgi:hypothetical protein
MLLLGAGLVGLSGFWRLSLKKAIKLEVITISIKMQISNSSAFLWILRYM